MDDMQRMCSGPRCLEATFEKATVPRILVIPILLDGICFLFLPSGVLLCRLARWEQFGPADENTSHFPDLGL
jgi:hypothetical protein